MTTTNVPHTPGPYHANAIFKGRIVGDETAKSPMEYIDICSRNMTVARVYRPRDVPLFRAAPDLLAALKGIIDYAERDIGEVEDLTKLGDDRAELDEALGSLAFAYAAIRKAEGGGT